MSLPQLKKIIESYFPQIIFLFSLFFIVKTLFLNFYPDFKVHYLAPLAIFNGVNPYLGGKNFFTPDVHPPFAIFLFSPFTLFSYPVAEKLWTLISIALFFGSLTLIFKINKEKIYSKTGLLLTALICSFYFPVKFTLGMGQINFLILFLAVLSIYFLNKGKYYYSGFFLSLSVMIKFFPLLFLPYLVILKKWRVIFSFIIFFLGISAIVFLINPGINVDFYKNVLPTLLGGWKADYYNQSLSGFLARGVEDIYLREIIRIIISSLFILFSLILILKSPKSLINLCLSLLITITLIINNFSWQHHFVWLLFPFITLFFYIKNNKLGPKYFFILGLSFFLVGINLSNPRLFPVILISHVFYGTIVLWGLNFYLISKRLGSRI